MTVIPTYGFAANDAMYLALHVGAALGRAGRVGDQLQRASAKSTDQGQHLDQARRPALGRREQLRAGQRREARRRAALLGRHPRPVRRSPADEGPGGRMSRITDAYRYFTGTRPCGRSASGRPTMAAATTIVDDTVGELSVVWNDHLSRWLMTYTNGGGAASSIREGSTPWGPWGEPIITALPAGSARALLAVHAAALHRRRRVERSTSRSRLGSLQRVWYRADLVRAD